MAELTINVRYEREDDIFDVEIEADLDGINIESELEYDKQFQELLSALNACFVEIVDKLNAEEIKNG